MAAAAARKANNKAGNFGNSEFSSMQLYKHRLKKSAA
jgi:hypothetical protein